jgi:DNA replication protein DnaC
MDKMQKLLPPPIYKKEKCNVCKKEYSAKLINIGGQLKEATLGLCESCLSQEKRQWEQQQKQADENYRAAEVAGRRRLIRERMIPPLYINEDFSTFKVGRGNLKKVKDACMEYADKFPMDYRQWVLEKKFAYPSLCLFSGVGTGKTHLSCAIAHRMLDRWKGETGIPFYFTSEGNIYRRIIETYSYSYDEKTHRDSEDDIIRQLINFPLLILDDLAKESRSDMKFVRRVMFNIIDGRDKLNKPLVVTSNKNFDELAVYLNEDGESPCCDRLFKMTAGNQWEILAESYRTNPIK